MKQYFSKCLVLLLLVGTVATLSARKTDRFSVLLPTPKHIEKQRGEFVLKNASERWYDDVWYVKLRTVNQLDGVPSHTDEGYRLEVSQSHITITATSLRGVYWGKQTLRQLATTKNGTVRVPACTITDYPAFPIRGFMHDVGRSFIPIDELKREIAIASQYKINTFHWHLTENQAWRLQSKRYPELTSAQNMTRDKGLFYTQEEARELMQFCTEHQVTLIPELDMPGHSAAFLRAFGVDMQSQKGMEILKNLIGEACEVFSDVPYLHIGTDEVKFTNPNFVPEMVAFVRSKGKKVISWHPGWNYKKGEIDMTHLWSYRGTPIAGVPSIDSKFHYLNHFDIFGDIVALYNSRVYNCTESNDSVAGAIIAIWNDRKLTDYKAIVRDNSLYPNLLALAERTWIGGGTEYFNGNGVILRDEQNEGYKAFADFERRMLWHKNNALQSVAFPYVKQTNVRWRITDAFPNGGDLSKKFPPEYTLGKTYEYEGVTYATQEITGAGIYLRHVWGKTVPALYEAPKENSTAYAYTWVYSPKTQTVGLLFETQNYSRSEKDLPPPIGKWDYRESTITLNDKPLTPPTWLSERTQDNENLLTNENATARPPLQVTLHKGWNKVFIKLPIGKFRIPETRLVKWMFTAVFVTPDGKNAVDGLIYSPERKK